MSRLRFPTALSIIAALLLATGIAACGDEDGAGGDAQAVIDSATLRGIDSGELDLFISVSAEGKEGGDVDVSFSGPFQSGGEGELPQLDLTADVKGSVSGEDVDFEGGLVLLPNSAYVNYQGTEYEVDPTTFSFVESALERAQRGAGNDGKSSSVTACQEALGRLQVGDFMDDLSEDGGADVDGTSTTKVSGDLDVGAAIDSLVEVAEDPACSAQIGAAGPLPSQSEIDEAKSTVEDSVKTAHIDAYVGEDDIVRQLSAQLEIEPSEGSGDGPESAEIDFELKLTGVNEEQEISAPRGAKPLSDLFLKLGINPIELLGLLQGEGGGEGLGNLLEDLGGAAGGFGGGR